MSSLTPSIQPSSGVIGLPTGVKEQGRRVDFRPDDFTLAIETKGYRLAWSRAGPCPCDSVNPQTEQPDPNCPVCEGSGWFYFTPSEAVSTPAGSFTNLQSTVISRYEAGVIRGIMTQGTAEFDPYNKVGNWRDGQMMLTVRPENRLGYYDRLVNLDSEMVYAETLDAGPATEDSLNLRYDCVRINLLRSIDTVYEPTLDFTLELGNVKWLPGRQPAEGTRLMAHYYTFPVWLITEHPHVVRGTLLKFKKPRVDLTSPQGDQVALPVQALIRYEFLVR